MFDFLVIAIVVIMLVEFLKENHQLSSYFVIGVSFLIFRIVFIKILSSISPITDMDNNFINAMMGVVTLIILYGFLKKELPTLFKVVKLNKSKKTF